jgi:hypothetical protein
MNHSPRFWATVQSIFPEFAKQPSALCAIMRTRDPADLLMTRPIVVFAGF